MEQAQGQHPRWRARTAVISSGLTLTVAMLVLAAWMMGVSWVPRLAPAGPTMTPNTAAGLFALALALLIRMRLFGQPESRRVALAFFGVLTGSVALLAVLTLTQYAWQVELGIDRVLAASGRELPGWMLRPSPRTSLEFVLLAGALCLSETGWRKSQRWAESLLLLSLPLPSLALIGHLYSVRPLYGVTETTGMAPHTALLCVALAIGTLCSLRQSLVLDLLASRQIGGALARRLLPGIALAPLALGWLQLQGQAHGLYRDEYGVALFVIANTVLLGLLVWFTSRRLNHLDRMYLQAQDQYRALAENAEDAILTYDQGERITYLNPAAERIFGVSRAQTAGMRVDELIRGREPNVTPLFGRSNGGESTAATGREMIGTRSGQNSFPIELSLGTWQAQSQRFTTAIVRDITERQRAERALARRTQQLELANAELTAFAYSASHDLRAPVRSIDGFLTLALDECGDALTETARGYLGRIRGAVVAMRDLIEGLISLSQVSTRELRDERIDLGAIARAIMLELQAAEPQRRLELSTAGELFACGDPGLLRSLMQNLLGNAWKYTATRPVTRIAVGSEAGNGSAIFFVRDNGVGFDPQWAHRVFEPFQRLHSEQQFKGAGIGLATVKRIVNRYGGKIWAHSEPGRSATFRFTLETMPRADRERMDQRVAR